MRLRSLLVAVVLVPNAAAAETYDEFATYGQNRVGQFLYGGGPYHWQTAVRSSSLTDVIWGSGAEEHEIRNNCFAGQSYVWMHAYRDLNTGARYRVETTRALIVNDETGQVSDITSGGACGTSGQPYALYQIGGPYTIKVWMNIIRNDGVTVGRRVYWQAKYVRQANEANACWQGSGPSTRASLRQDEVWWDRYKDDLTNVWQPAVWNPGDGELGTPTNGPFAGSTNPDDREPTGEFVSGYRWMSMGKGAGWIWQGESATGVPLCLKTSLDSLVDEDGDGAPNGVEASEGLNPLMKDNNIFANARLFAMQQYRDFLGREGDAGGVSFHTQNINSGSTPRPQVISNFLSSPEFQGGLPQCTRLYFSFFLRIPDYPGLMFQLGRYRAGDPLEVISQNFSNSPEFTSRYGSLSNEQYVDLVYQNVLNRAPDAEGRQYYLDRLNDGRLTRGQMMVGFSESPEFQQMMDNEVYVTSVYVGMLRRTPDQAGMNFYLGPLDAGAPRTDIINAFLGSTEYRNRFLP